MQRLYATAALCATLALLASSAFELHLLVLPTRRRRLFPKARTHQEPTMGNSRFRLRPRIRR